MSDEPGTPPIPVPPANKAGWDTTQGGKYCGARTSWGRKHGPDGIDERGAKRYAYCRKPPGCRTDHPGIGRCKSHGGSNSTNLAILRHGRLSKIRHGRIGALVDQYYAEPDPLKLYREVAVARALYTDFIERYEEMSEALLAWHADWQVADGPISEEKVIGFERTIDEYEILLRDIADPTEAQKEMLLHARKYVDALRRRSKQAQKPRKIIDIADAAKIVEATSRIIERIENIGSQNAISRPELVRIMGEMGRIVVEQASIHMKDVEVQNEFLRIVANEWRRIAFLKSSTTK